MAYLLLTPRWGVGELLSGVNSCPLMTEASGRSFAQTTIVPTSADPVRIPAYRALTEVIAAGRNGE